MTTPQSLPPAQEFLLTLPIGLGITAALAALAVTGIVLGAGPQSSSGPAPALREHTVYTDCTVTEEHSGAVLMDCQAPEQAEVFLTGRIADSVLTRPEAVYSVPVEDTVQPGEPGWVEDQELFHIGVPYITAAG